MMGLKKTEVIKILQKKRRGSENYVLEDNDTVDDDEEEGHDADETRHGTLDVDNICPRQQKIHRFTNSTNNC